MTLGKIEPFVRQASIVTLGSASHYEIYHELRTPDCRLFYITAGSGSVTLEGKQYRLCVGSIILIRGGTRYIWQPASGDKLTFISVNFDYTAAHSHIKKSFHPVHSQDFSDSLVLEKINIEDAAILNCPTVTENTVVLELLHTLVAEYCLGGSLRDELLSSLLKSALIMIVRAQNEHADGRGDKGSKLTRALIQYIENNYRDNITNETVAAAFHYSSSYINRVFKKHTGMPLHAFLLHYRMKIAMELLSSQKCQISETAVECGFRDPVHFTKSFKQHTGKTPSEFAAGD